MRYTRFDHAERQVGGREVLRIVRNYGGMFSHAMKVTPVQAAIGRNLG
jgi:hypothetical protein